MKVYLSGPMTGIPDYNYPAFHEAAHELRSRGKHEVVNPAESHGGDQSLPYTEYLRHDIAELLTVDAIVCLPGWEVSSGAVLEVAIGAGLGLELLEYRQEVGGFSLRNALPVLETDKERLAFVLGTPPFGPAMFTPLAPAAGPAPVEPLTSWAEADSELLKAADAIVNGDRQRTYGHPMDHHEATARMWAAYLGRVNDLPDLIVRPRDVSMLFILDKASRVGGGDKVDNLLDIAGYAQVHAKVRAREELA